MNLRTYLLPLLLAGVFACRDKEATTEATSAAKSARDGGSDSRVVATVNGAPLTELDLLTKLREGSHTEEMKPEYKKNVLDALVRDELILQRGIALGLDADPVYRDAVQKKEAELAALRRKQMGELYFRNEIAARVAVTDDEARAYFDAHADDFRTERRILQIMKRDRASIEDAKKELDAGKSFEDVARAGFPGMKGEGQTPWDLGYLKWGQLVPEWREPLAKLKAGESTGIVAGQKDRFWILKLVDVRKADVQFADSKAALVELLRGEKLAKRRAEAEEQLRAAAKIVVTP